eukprot:CAMPEP_0179287712 /NCGR_PEP_ID=MMETSP0797-20121207/40407_1 /TAXON_ID=47934 /ORGANISM="Dinophysis acuminata, Strain DAEP01" /LENGTH=100 /DNA_ID=CAMNT_0020996653 /DNA_START=118 /DNA_END=417 /DNA_ORIENTATION=+
MADRADMKLRQRWPPPDEASLSNTSRSAPPLPELPDASASLGKTSSKQYLEYLFTKLAYAPPTSSCETSGCRESSGCRVYFGPGLVLDVSPARAASAGET